MGKGYKRNYQSYFVGIFVQNNLLKMNGLVDIQLGLNYIFLNFLPKDSIIKIVITPAIIKRIE